MLVPATAEEKTSKKNDVKARSLLLMALPNEHQLTFSVVIIQEDLNSKILRSLPLEWNTHKSVGTSTNAQNIAFMTVLSTSSTNDVNTANPVYEACTISPNVNTASPQVSTANFSDNVVYAFMVKNPNGSNLQQPDLEQIHKDDLEAMDLRWRLSLLSVMVKRYFQRIGNKIFINANDIVGYDKSKVECFNYHKMRRFSREHRGQRNQDGWFRNQDNTRKQGNNEDTSSKAMLAIDGVGFDWSDMAEEHVQKSMALMVFSNSEKRHLLPHKKTYTTPTLTHKLFSNMRRAFKGYNEVDIQLFPTMLVQGQIYQGVESTVPVESHHTPTNAPSTSQPPTSTPSMQTTHDAEELATIRHDSPLPRVQSLGSVEGSLTLNELTVLCIKLSKRVDDLQSDLQQKKLTARVVLSDDEEDLEDPSKHGRKIAEIDENLSISLVQEDSKIQRRTSANTEILLDQEEPTKLVEDIGICEKGENKISTVIPEVSTAVENLVFFIIAVQTPGSGISILLAVGTPFTGSGNLYCQWELSPGSGNALCILSQQSSLKLDAPSALKFSRIK
uniref:Uncharacterized protein n=1 Tax=Tanacetum cinerariifolium TaxID=118510 RepID=A0A6L2N093_TANCI|nr:hypothetical protein [Tanacetum cinerariifolium]